jgi:hypothetical protein
VPSLVSAAVMEHRAGNAGRARALYAAALQQDPSNPKLLHAVAQMYLREGDRAAAEQHLAALQVCVYTAGTTRECQGVSSGHVWGCWECTMPLCTAQYNSLQQHAHVVLRFRVHQHGPGQHCAASSSVLV